MIELTSDQYKNVIQHLVNVKQPVVPRAVTEGFNQGRIFADQSDDPCCALVWLPCGYLYLAGEPGSAISLQEFSCLLLDEFIPGWTCAGESGFILAPFSTAWEKLVVDFVNDRPHENIFRRRFIFNPDHFSIHLDWAQRIPPGFLMRRVDTELVALIGGMPTWPSIGGFLQKGIGYCLLEGDQLVSACTSVFATHSSIEIDVHTEEVYQHRGFATLTAAALIDECLRGGRMPKWECFWDNEASAALANRLGFDMVEDYPVYYFE